MASIALEPRRAAPAQPIAPVQDTSALAVQQLFLHFLIGYTTIDGTSESSPPRKEYVLKALEMQKRDTTTLFVDYVHMIQYAQAGLTWVDEIRNEYYRYEPFLHNALQEFMREQVPQHAAHKILTHNPFHISFVNLPIINTIRDLHTNTIGQLMSISGTVTRTSAVRPELAMGTFVCADCGTVNYNIAQQFKYTEPTHCVNIACANRIKWTLDTAKSTFQDWQMIRIQENSSEIPAGSMPRSLKIILRHEIVEHAKPGDKCIFTGQLLAIPDVQQLSSTTRLSRASNRRIDSNNSGGGVTGLKALGVRELTYALCFMACSISSPSSLVSHAAPEQLDEQGNPLEADELSEFSDEQRERIKQMKGMGKVYQKMVGSIAPNIFGHDEIKRGILLMLFGGVHKRTSDGQNLRGDINVCIVGDPSTSKSQFLKYVCTFLPRAVYTSGKASSAAGLTASIARDPETGEFAIEAGALMLADNSICCIDEFDKMESADQVAIHEAMEQQTISIAKAGIQATLNARTSILAAANPLKGRYDPSRTLKQNVDISAPIMSRFDLFFVVLDECDQTIDYGIAKHIVNVHLGKENYTKPVFTMEDLQLYVRYARTKKPKISAAAKSLFVEHYKQLRAADATGASRASYRITVRQLESMIRLAEARARVELEQEVTPAHVKEAARLLKQSIVHVETQDVRLEDDEEEVEEQREREQEEEDEQVHAPARTSSQPRSPARSSPARAQASPAREQVQEQEEPREQELTLPFAEYQRICLLLVRYMRSREDKGLMDCSWNALVEWYVQHVLESDSQSMGSDEELAAQIRLVELVIHRLVKVDHILLVTRKSKDKRKRLLQVHPNFTGEAGEQASLEAEPILQAQAQDEEEPDAMQDEPAVDTQAGTEPVRALLKDSRTAKAQELPKTPPRRGELRAQTPGSGRSSRSKQ